MEKRNTLNDMISFTMLRKAARKAIRHIVITETIARFLSDLDRNLLRLQHSLLSGSWQPKPMHAFEIRDPKPRLIQAAAIEDRIVHHALCAQLEPIFAQLYFPNSFACQKGKGNSRAVQQAHTYCREFSYFAKLDIQHYFESFPHTPFWERVSPLIEDAQIQNILERLLIHGGNDIGKGLPIGNLTSQHFANFYLHFFDDWCTQANIPWIRYMDDILLFSHHKSTLEEAVQDGSAFLNDVLQLPIKYTAYREAHTKKGVPFLGFCIFPHKIHLDGARKRRFFRKMNQAWKNQEDKRVQQSMQSIIAWTEQGDCIPLRQSWHKRRGETKPQSRQPRW